MTQNLGSTSNPLSMTGEQWVLEERTDDPLSPEPGECWIRTDLNAGDKIATLKFGDGSEVPIFPTGTSEPGVLEVRRVQTGGQTGYLPVAEPDESRFPQFRLQHNNTVYSLHDDIEPGAIPDSGLLHEYDARVLSSETTFADQVGGNDLSSDGSPSLVSDGINGQQIVRYNGSDAHIGTEYTTTKYTFAFLIKPNTTSGDNVIVSNEGNPAAHVSFDSEWSAVHSQVASNSSGSVAADTVYVGAMSYDGSNLQLQIADSTIVDVSVGTESLNRGLAIAARFNADNDPSNQANMDFGHGLFYDEYYDSDGRSEIISGLESDWGVTSGSPT